MSKYPSITGKQLIKILKKFGFTVTRKKGSHHFLKHKDGRCTTIPVHSNETKTYTEAQRLLTFLELFKSVPTSEVPPTSILREFIGGSSFKY